MAIDGLFKKHNFNTHPFHTWIAEDELDIAEWFVAPRFLDTLIGKAGRGKPLSPSSSLVFGRPGSGKTALRKMIEREIQTDCDGVLVLRYVNFVDVLSQSPKPSLNDHIDEILRLATVGLIAKWQSNPNYYLNLGLTEKAELAGLVYHYYDTLPQTEKLIYVNDLNPVVGKLTGAAKIGKKALVELYNTTISVLRRDRINPTSWTNDSTQDREQEARPILRLQRFWSLASRLGVKSIWVLIDGVDEAPGVSSPEGIYNVLSELLFSQPVMEFRPDKEQLICFKVFLTRPEKLKPLLKKNGFRLDRIKIEDISWQRKDLDSVLQKRLAYFSNKNVLNFDSICMPEAAGTHDRLLDEADLRPRTLFRMAHEILSEFQRKSEVDDVYIDTASIEHGIVRGKDAVFC